MENKLQLPLDDSMRLSEFFSSVEREKTQFIVSYWVADVVQI